jgi:hypothetical protein
MGWLSDWWNGVELWMLGLPFPFQFALVMVVLLPLFLVLAWLIDRVVDRLSDWFGTGEQDPPLRGEPRREEPDNLVSAE